MKGSEKGKEKGKENEQPEDASAQNTKPENEINRKKEENRKIEQIYI